MEKTISSPRLDEDGADVKDADTDEDSSDSSDENDVVQAGSTAVVPRKPSLTVRQFGTTQSSVPEHSNRTVLLGVAALALAAGLAAGFYIMRGGAQGLVGDAVGAGSAEYPVTEPSSAAVPSAGEANSESADAAAAEEGDAEAETADAGPDANADAAVDASAHVVAADEEDAEDTKPRPRVVDASTDRDWGKVEDSPSGGTATAGDAGKGATTPSSDAGSGGSSEKLPKLPLPPPPISPD
jgi:hypothetical protein